jgi:hypothetical protein
MASSVIQLGKSEGLQQKIFFYVFIRSNVCSNSVQSSTEGMLYPARHYNTLDQVWDFSEQYCSRVVFDLRKMYSNPSKYDGTITSCRFECHKEGLRAKDRSDKHIKQPCAEIRTDFHARMGLADREVEN